LNKFIRFTLWTESIRLSVLHSEDSGKHIGSFRCASGALGFVSVAGGGEHEVLEVMWKGCFSCFFFKQSMNSWLGRCFLTLQIRTCHLITL